jgi:hypothetical protein
MANDGWYELDGQEFINQARTVALAETLGIDTVWVRPETVDWIEGALGESDYWDITEAPWYDPGFAASSEFAGLLVLSMAGINNSSLEGSSTEYITNGGRSAGERNSTLPIVASVVLVASTPRGLEFGTRWAKQRLRTSGGSYFCRGANLRYFRHAPMPGATTFPMAHRRDVSLTRSVSITRERITDCAAMRWATYTWTANDPFEYSEPVTAAVDLGNGLPLAVPNLNSNPLPVSFDGYTANGTASYYVDDYIRVRGIVAAPAQTDTNVSIGGDVGAIRLGMEEGKTYTIAATSGEFVAGGGTPYSRARAIAGYYRVGVGSYSVSSSPAVTGPGQRVSATMTLPAGTTEAFFRLYFGYGYTGLPGGYQEWKDITVTEGPTSPEVPPSGDVAMVEMACPRYDYTPIYDPMFPAMVAPPAPPNFFPAGWDIEDGDTFNRSWIQTAAIEPSSLDLVPIFRLTSPVEARMLRLAVWSSDTGYDEQCAPLFSAVVSYLPPNVNFYIDGEQEACYAWDGVSPAVRRTDSLVYAPDASPVQWTAFNDDEGLYVTLDTFGGSSDEDGGEDVRVDVSFVAKSD